jgi:hypothetical protein
MKHHQLKCIQPHFEEIWLKRKTFEIRLNDRNFKVGDTICLMEYDSQDNFYTGNQVFFLITHILHSYQDIIKEGYVILSISETHRISNQK